MSADFGISGVSERDIDLLLLEEFVAAPDFVRWFALETAGLEEANLLSAYNSVTQSAGESDLEVAIDLADERIHYLLIENKIDAQFQPRQAERYRERGAAYLEQGECSSFTMILVAPKKFLGRKDDLKGFDAKITYEEIREWFETKPGGQIKSYKVELLSSAINRATLGYQPVRDASVTDFWHAYWELASKVAPELEMKEPEAKPGRADFVWFTPSILPKEVTIVHKMGQGNVDLQLAGRGGRHGGGVEGRVLPRLRGRLS